MSSGNSLFLKKQSLENKQYVTEARDSGDKWEISRRAWWVCLETPGLAWGEKMLDCLYNSHLTSYTIRALQSWVESHHNLIYSQWGAFNYFVPMPSATEIPQKACLTIFLSVQGTSSGRAFHTHFLPSFSPLLSWALLGWDCIWILLSALGWWLIQTVWLVLEVTPLTSQCVSYRILGPSLSETWNCNIII